MTLPEIDPNERIARYLYTHRQIDGKKYFKYNTLKPRKIYKPTRIGSISLQRLEYKSLDQFKSHAQKYDTPEREMRFVGIALLHATEITDNGLKIFSDPQDGMPHAEIRIEQYVDGEPLESRVSAALYKLEQIRRIYWDSKDGDYPCCIDEPNWCGCSKDQMK